MANALALPGCGAPLPCPPLRAARLRRQPLSAAARTALGRAALGRIALGRAALGRAAAAGTAWGLLVGAGFFALRAYETGLVCPADAALTTLLAVAAGIPTVGLLAALAPKASVRAPAAVSPPPRD